MLKFKSLALEYAWYKGFYNRELTSIAKFAMMQHKHDKHTNESTILYRSMDSILNKNQCNRQFVCEEISTTRKL